MNASTTFGFHGLPIQLFFIRENPFDPFIPRSIFSFKKFQRSKKVFTNRQSDE